MIGTALNTFIVNLNGGATIDTTFLNVLVQTAQAVLEEERPWMVLRKTDTSKTVATSSTWQTAIDVSTITDFSRFYDNKPLKIFDGTNRVAYFVQVPFDRRLEYKDTAGTFVFDENAKVIYLNGVIAFSGTLYINYVSTGTVIDVTSASEQWTVFPSRFIPLVGFYAIGIHKGAVDYDDVVKNMLPENRAVMMALKNAMEKWDNERQLSTLEVNDPTEQWNGGGARVNIHE